MSAFKSERFFDGPAVDVEGTARELAAHFAQRAYQVETIQVGPDAWQVGITRGGVFKAALGLRSALKIDLEQRPKGLYVHAGAGIFGKQAVPTAITMLVAWPVILTQVWGLVREAGLDDEAIRVVEVSVARQHRLLEIGTVEPGAFPAPSTPQPPLLAPPPSSRSRFCPACGTEHPAAARFCSGCGSPLPGPA